MTSEPLARRLRRELDKPTDVAMLVVFRIAFGLVVSVGAMRFIFEGWVERCYLTPTIFFKYLGFHWVTVWPAWGMYLHFGVVAVLGLMVAAGLFYRVSAALMFVAFTYLELIDVTVYLNHYYLVSLLALLAACMPLGRAGSLDAWRKPESRLDAFPAWCTALLRFQVGAVYVYAGLTKCGGDWLLHGQPLHLWLASRSGMPIVGPYLDRAWLAVAMSWAGFLYDVTIPLWLSLRRTRLPAYLVLLAFHIAVGVLFNIGMFPFIMSTAALVFFPPSFARAFAARVLKATPSESAAHGPSAPAIRLGGVSYALMLAYVVVQVAMPLRHFMYPGNVLWNEQGMRWAWKVLIREKNGAVTYVVTRADGRREFVEPRRYLTEAQAREMSGQPDLILQLAHHIADEFAARGHGPVQVRVEASVSLNGRRPKLLIDPAIDLAQVEDGIGVAAWILPEPNEPPIRLNSLAGGSP